MKFLVTVLLSLLLLSIESVVVKYLGLTVSRIDVTVAIVAFLGLRASLSEGALSSFCVGYLVDLMSGQPTGLYTFLSVFTFLICRLAGTLVDIRSGPSFALFAAAADLGHAVLSVFFLWLTSSQAAVAGSAWIHRQICWLMAEWSTVIAGASAAHLDGKEKVRGPGPDLPASG